MKGIRHFVTHVALCLLLLPLMASAQYDEIVVFGDSLSDNGNLAAINPGVGAIINAPPYDQGRVTNGPVAVEVLAELLRLPLSASLADGGDNYAVAGARAARLGGSLDFVSLSSQVTSYLGRSRPARGTLIVIFIGGNDVRESLSLAREPARRLLIRSADSIAAQVLRLINVGAENIMVAGSPDVSKTPEVLANARQLGSGLLQRARWGTAFFNTALTSRMRRVETATDARIVGVDVESLFDAIDSDPDDFGFSVVNRPCFQLNESGQPVYDRECGPGPDKIKNFIYFDQIHPSAKIHDRAGRFFYTLVPVPSL